MMDRNGKVWLPEGRESKDRSDSPSCPTPGLPCGSITMLEGMSAIAYLRPLSLCCVLLFAQGCEMFMPKTTARVKASSRVKPVIAALDVYHREHGGYPATLDELRPRYLSADIPLEEKTERGVRWGLHYKRPAPDAYELLFEDAYSDALYKNGKLVSATSNPFR